MRSTVRAVVLATAGATGVAGSAFAQQKPTAAPSVVTAPAVRPAGPAAPAQATVQQLNQATPAVPAPGQSGATQPAAAQPTGSWPKTLEDAKAEAALKVNPPPPWPAQEIALAKARCTQILQGLDVVAVPEPAFRDGECGAAAPVRLISIGRKPEVALNPPPLVTCDVAAAMHQWVKESLQPLSKKHLGSELIKIETMSDYSCRNAYGRKKSRLSEHGRANAIDIRSFTTSRGAVAVLLEDWGMTARDIAAQVAAAKAAAEKAAAEKAAQAAAAAAAAKTKAPGQPGAAHQPTVATVPAPTPSVAAGSPALIARPTIVDGLPRVTVTVPSGAPAEGAVSRAPAYSGFPDPNRLGGPRDGKLPHPAAVQDPTTGRMKFLREAHVSACRIFGTVLGPEANNAHRNHFHVDMAERNNGNFCE